MKNHKLFKVRKFTPIILLMNDYITYMYWSNIDCTLIKCNECLTHDSCIIIANYIHPFLVNLNESFKKYNKIKKEFNIWK